MYDFEGSRGSGRTTRMIFDAIKTAFVTKERVWIVAGMYSEVHAIGRIITNVTGIDNPNVRINVIPMVNSAVRQDELGITIRGVKSELVFVDHWVYTLLLRKQVKLLEGLNKYEF